MAEQVPSIGRVVHFVLNDGTHVPAIIISPDQNDGAKKSQLLQVFTLEASYTAIAPYDAACAGDTWHWPEYVPAKDGRGFIRFDPDTLEALS